MKEHKPVFVAMTPYTWEKRLKAGIKTAVKVALPLLPQIADFILGWDIPYKNTISAVLLAAVAIQKAAQKDRTKQ